MGTTFGLRVAKRQVVMITWLCIPAERNSVKIALGSSVGLVLQQVVLLEFDLGYKWPQVLGMAVPEPRSFEMPNMFRTSIGTPLG